MLDFADKMEDVKGKVTGFFSRAPQEPDPNMSCTERLWKSLELSYTKRVIMAAILLGAGLLLLGFSTMFFLIPTKFGKMYTFGNIFVLAATLFIVGPTRQISSIVQDKSKAIAAVIYIASMVFTLTSALKFKSAILTGFFVIVQFAAAIWYVASYIPYAHSCLSSTARSILPI